jgi:hypothetical protein
MRAPDQTAHGLRVPQREGMKMMTLSANAQRIGDDIMRLVNAGNQSGNPSSTR